MRFGFLLKRGKREAQDLASELGRALAAQGVELCALAVDAPFLPGARVVTEAELGSAVDVLVVLGGDGTLLYAATVVGESDVPLLGVNLGNLGFLTSCTRAEAAEAVAAAAAGKLGVDQRMRLAVRVVAGGQEVATRLALNDAVLSQPEIARLLDLETRLAGNLVATYKADGLIVSSPTGSTAYSLSAGGPILGPDMEAFVLTPICPHTLTNRPLVVRADAPVSVRNASDHPVTLTVDGQWSRSLAPGDGIEVRRAARPLRLLRAPTSFFGILQKKLAWGERASDGV